MILRSRSVPAIRRRSAFTLLEVLTVVAIILVLASIATVSVLQILKENKDDQAKINANSLAQVLRMYMVKKDTEPGSIQDLLPYVEGGDPAKLLDPWGKEYQIGRIEQNGVTSFYIFTISGNTGEEIRSDVRQR
jgi:general secretion pathway protein G